MEEFWPLLTPGRCYICELECGETERICEFCEDNWTMYAAVMFGRHGFYPMRDARFLLLRREQWIEERHATHQQVIRPPPPNACMLCRGPMFAVNNPNRAWRACPTCQATLTIEGRKKFNDSGIGVRRKARARNAALYGWRIVEHTWQRRDTGHLAEVRWEYPGWRVYFDGKRRGFFNTAHSARVACGELLRCAIHGPDDAIEEAQSEV